MILERGKMEEKRGTRMEEEMSGEGVGMEVEVEDRVEENGRGKMEKKNRVERERGEIGKGCREW